ncbi:MAG: hypothetical protein LZF62_350071 [Nitrospira sp.]|nr:MAG: hypothetical protein LZF62_350071 [Nitrospira sp.]
MREHHKTILFDDQGKPSGSMNPGEGRWWEVTYADTVNGESPVGILSARSEIGCGGGLGLSHSRPFLG